MAVCPSTWQLLACVHGTLMRVEETVRDTSSSEAPHAADTAGLRKGPHTHTHTHTHSSPRRLSLQMPAY
eukprot:1755897-Amphidinium_carterae.1